VLDYVLTLVLGALLLTNALLATTGYAPFESEDEEELLDLICNADFEFHDDYWNDIEQPPKDLIQQLLEADPKKRLTARQALRTPWLRRRDRDWVQNMDDSHSTFQSWLERRNNSMNNSMNGSNNSGHLSLGSLSLAVGGNPNDSNRSLNNWEIDGDSGHNTDAKSFASEPGPMQDSASTNGYSEADLCSE
jgi:serine/threonine protein kinase